MVDDGPVGRLVERTGELAVGGAGAVAARAAGQRKDRGPDAEAVHQREVLLRRPGEVLRREAPTGVLLEMAQMLGGEPRAGKEVLMQVDPRLWDRCVSSSRHLGHAV